MAGSPADSETTASNLPIAQTAPTFGKPPEGARRVTFLLINLIIAVEPSGEARTIRWSAVLQLWSLWEVRGTGVVAGPEQDPGEPVALGEQLIQRRSKLAVADRQRAMFIRAGALGAH